MGWRDGHGPVSACWSDGLTALTDGFDEPCLLPTDFLPRYRDPALPIRDIREQFATSTLARQFFFMDACRGVLTDRVFRASGISSRRRRDHSLPEPDQYVRFATSAGDSAYETSSTGGAEGAFTAALMRGLAGEGGAKRWDPYTEQYVVRVQELSAFVRAELIARGVPQVPRPPEAAAQTTVGALGPGDRISRPPLQNPLTLRLAPRTYSIRAYSPNFTARRRSWLVDLYQDAMLEIDLEPGSSAEVPAWTVTPPLRSFVRCSRADSPVAIAADRTAVIESVDEGGEVRYAAGTMEFERSGRYRLRVVEPHGAGPIRFVEVSPDGQREVRLAAAPAPSALASMLATAAGIGSAHDGWWRRRDGQHLAPLPASAVTGLAALSALAPDTPGNAGAGRDALGIAPIAADLAMGGSGVLVVVVGTDRSMSTHAVGSGTGSLTPLRSCHAQTSAAALALPAGPAVVALHGLFDAELRVAVYVSPGHPALLVVELSQTGEPLVLGYPAADAGVGMDALLRADRAQRFAAQGRIAEALAVLGTGPAGVLGDVLRGLLAARSGAAHVEHVTQAATALRVHAPGLPDLAVLDAMAHAHKGLRRGVTRVHPPRLSAVPVTAAALRAAARLFNDGGAICPDRSLRQRRGSSRTNPYQPGYGANLTSTTTGRFVAIQQGPRGCARVSRCWSSTRRRSPSP